MEKKKKYNMWNPHMAGPDGIDPPYFAQGHAYPKKKHPLKSL